MERNHWTVIKFPTGDERESTFYGPFFSAKAVTNQLGKIDKSGGYSVCEIIFHENGQPKMSTYGEWDGEKVVISS